MTNLFGALLLCVLLPISYNHEGVQEIVPSENGKEPSSITLDISEISDDSFNGVLPWPYPCVYTVHYALGEDYCVGDRVDVFYTSLIEEGRTDSAANWTAQVEAEQVRPSDFELEPAAAYKPVIYLYPEEPTDVSVQLDYSGSLTHTWPLYETGGWQVLAQPDSTLTDAAGRSYPYLFWEGVSDTVYDMSQGFCVAGADSKVFLQEALTKLGLNETEADEFMEFWLPHLEKNPYNLLAFQGDAYTQSAELAITPEPDTLIRVFLAFRPLNALIEIPPQNLAAPERIGFTVVEWGGAVAP